MKPEFILHRVNSLQQLQQMESQSLGCEIDLRSDVSRPGSLHLSHDPWVKGEDFETWLKVFSKVGQTGPLILNTKEDGLEEQTLQLLKAFGIDNFFFLDTTLPTLVKWTKKGESRFALRLSQFEPESLALQFAGKVDWVWMDCFETKPLPKIPDSIKKAGFRVCLVSPELQGGDLGLIKNFNHLWADANAICTKSPKSWTF